MLSLETIVKREQLSEHAMGIRETLDKREEEEEGEDSGKEEEAVTVPPKEIEWVTELKYDGMALSLVYDKDGVLTRATTRGNGYEGQERNGKSKTLGEQQYHKREWG
jgi:NAD-dependent DNA ligase